MDQSEILKVEGLEAGYGAKQILKRLSLRVAESEIVALIGHNGAGKSTLLKAVFGLIPISHGQIHFSGKIMKSLVPLELLKQGVVYVPQGSQVFAELTVKQNLELAGITLADKMRRNDGVTKAVALFPLLRNFLDRKAGTLSGGEKQMLALASAFVISPRLVLLDEPSLGLAPPLVSSWLERISFIARAEGVSVLIVEQKVREVLKIAHRVYVLRNGEVSFQGAAKVLQDESKLREVFL
jgi:ABC-type branched-subunit amino acid transport system ATPase component